MKKCPLCKKIYNNEGLISCPTDHCKLVPITSKRAKGSYYMQYIFSWIIPLVGFICGAIMLAKDKDEDKKAGRNCIIIGIVAVVIYTILGVAIGTAI